MSDEPITEIAARAFAAIESYPFSWHRWIDAADVEALASEVVKRAEATTNVVSSVSVVALDAIAGNAEAIASRAVDVLVEEIPAGCLGNLVEGELAALKARAVERVVAEVGSDISDARNKLRDAEPA
jgi:hypothetical protein